MRLLAPLTADLATWRLANGRPVGEEFVFGRRDGEVCGITIGAIGGGGSSIRSPRVSCAGMRPYDLRHAFCSLLIGEGMSIVEVAARPVTRRR